MIDVDHNIGATLAERKIDLACIALHGTWGEDGTIQGILEYLKIPYTGSGVLGSSIAYNKVVSKEIFVERGIPTAPYQVITLEDRGQVKRTLDLPVVVKPADQGSSIGVSIVRTESQWEAALDQALRGFGGNSYRTIHRGQTAGYRNERTATHADRGNRSQIGFL